MNIGDYDNRTPLHIACGGNKLEIVEFLLTVAKVNPSPKDRWGATPLNDADPYPELKQFLIQQGSVPGKK